MSTDYKHSCFFTGHRRMRISEKNRIRDKVRELCIKLITECNVDTFIAGAALGFDTLAAIEVLKLKALYPNIKLHLYIPCHGQADKWSKADIELYESIYTNADFVYNVTNMHYMPGCMQLRNHAMVDNAYYGIAFYNHPSSGTQQTLNYARNKDRRVTIIE